jgi:Mannosyltransferase (PIG-V)
VYARLSSFQTIKADDGRSARIGDGKRAAAFALGTVVWIHIVYFLVAYGFNASLAEARGRPLPEFFDLWLKWDAVAFLRIALHGYTSALTEQHPTAFFPLLPLLLRVVMALGVTGAGAGLLLSAIGAFIAFWYLYRLAETELGSGCGRLTVLYLALFPSSVFLVAGYAEPLFLAGAVASFYYARQGSWGKVALPAAVAAASRSSAVFLLAALAVEALVQRRASGRGLVRPLAALAFGSLPVLAYCFFLSRARGDPFFYFTDERLGWHRRFADPVSAFVNTFHHPGAPIEIAAAVVGVLFVVWSARAKQWSYMAYMLLLLTSLVTTTYYLSIPRLLLSFFPAPLLLAGATKDRPGAVRVILVIFGLLSLLGVIAFTYGLGFY